MLSPSFWFLLACVVRNHTAAGEDLKDRDSTMLLINLWQWLTTLYIKLVIFSLICIFALLYREWLSTCPFCCFKFPPITGNHLPMQVVIPGKLGNSQFPVLKLVHKRICSRSCQPDWRTSDFSFLGHFWVSCLSQEITCPLSSLSADFCTTRPLWMGWLWSS